MPNNDHGSSMTHQSKKKRIEDELPADVGQKPIQLQRRRVWRACESCRRKKIKCDGCEPTCSQCATSGSQCTWLQTKDRAALSRHYVQELEARLLHMESLFSQITPVLEQLGPSALNIPGSSTILENQGTQSPSSPTSVAQTLAGTDLNRAGSSPSPTTPIKVEDDVSESFGQLALDEHGHMRWIGGSSTMSLIQSFRALATSPLQHISPTEEDPRSPGANANNLYFPAAVFFGKVHALPGPEEAEYPERDLADKLVEAYFRRFHFLMPVMDKPSFLRRYKHLMDNIHDSTVARAETAFMALVFSLFACSARLVDDPRLSTGDDGGMGMVYYERALILQYISHAHIQVAHVQTFILMSSFLCSVNCLPQAWILIGQAVRIGQDLGLHRSPRRLRITDIERETRRKIWWGVYSLDRMLALALGRPLAIEDSDCDVEYPLDVDDENLPDYAGAKERRQPSLMAGWIALTALYKIAGRVLRDVYAIENCKDHLEPEKMVELQRKIEILDNDLTQWCDDLPGVFKSEPVTEEQVSMGAVLCSHYYSVLITLHRNFLPVKRDQPVITPKSTAKAVSSARSCIHLAPSIKNVVPPSHHLAFFIQHLFSSSVILLLYAMHASDSGAASAAMEEAKTSLPALESWEGYWPGARKCRELLIELTNTASKAIHEATVPVPAPVLSSPLHERRRSVTISTAGGRPMKSKPKRPQSRDPISSARSSARRAAASPYRVDSAQRARSTSRKRGHDETEAFDHSGVPLTSYYHNFSSPTARSNSSPHSSPASVNVPSPAMPVLDPPQEAGPSYAYGVPLSPVSPHGPSPPRYDYEFGMQQNPLNQSSPHPWNGNTSDQHGLDIYSQGSQEPFMSYSGNYGLSTIDTNYLTYDTPPDMLGGLSALSSTPPTASFAAPGLPFRGLDFIRNYNHGGYAGGGEQDALWQSFDPRAFGYDPDLPFAFNDSSPETREEGR